MIYVVGTQELIGVDLKCAKFLSIVSIRIMCWHSSQHDLREMSGSGMEMKAKVKIPPADETSRDLRIILLSNLNILKDHYNCSLSCTQK